MVVINIYNFLLNDIRIISHCMREEEKVFGRNILREIGGN
jgi:hypothetical protein